MSTRHPGSRFARHLEKICNLLNWEGRECFRFESIRSIRDNSSALMSTCHPRSRVARHLEKICNLCDWGVENVVDSTRFDRFVLIDVNPSSQKSKNCRLFDKGGPRMLSIRLSSIKSRRFVCLDVDPSSQKSICATLR